MMSTMQSTKNYISPKLLAPCPSSTDSALNPPIISSTSLKFLNLLCKNYRNSLKTFLKISGFFIFRHLILNYGQNIIDLYRKIPRIRGQYINNYMKAIPPFTWNCVLFLASNSLLQLEFNLFPVRACAVNYYYSR